MNRQEQLLTEYNDLKEKYQKNSSVNNKEELKNKLIELDYEFNKEYEKELESKITMTTTLDKEKIRLENLIAFVEEKNNEQRKLLNDFKKLTGLNIELSYLKYSDNIKEFKDRLENIEKYLSIKDEIIKAQESNNESKIKVLKNKLLKQEILNLLYEFCLVDSLEIEPENLDINRIIKQEQELNEVLDNKQKIKEQKIDLPQKEELPKEVIKKEEIPEQEEEQEQKILTSMPKVDKIGTVVPVNIYESLQKTEEKLPDVVLPSNGLNDDQKDIFIDTTDMFEEQKEGNK